MKMQLSGYNSTLNLNSHMSECLKPLQFLLSKYMFLQCINTYIQYDLLYNCCGSLSLHFFDSSLFRFSTITLHQFICIESILLRDLPFLYKEILSFITQGVKCLVLNFKLGKLRQHKFSVIQLRSKSRWGNNGNSTWIFLLSSSDSVCAMSHFCC